MQSGPVVATCCFQKTLHPFVLYLVTTVSLQVPEDVVEDLKRIAPQLGFSNYEPLMRAYIGQGLRADLERLEANPQISDLIESLRRHGVKDEIIASAIAEIRDSSKAA
jgi:hypothetical protein